jgi:Zn-dependent peptidase ImmA (M78 family)
MNAQVITLNIEDMEKRPLPKHVNDFIDADNKHRELEREANVFALLLLIPQKMIQADLKKGIDLASDTDMKRLCAKYGVSQTTMMARIGLLNIKP